VTGNSAGFEEKHFLCGDGLSLYYRDYGIPSHTKLAILCLPDLTRNSKDFHGLAHRFSKERRVLCPDYRGRGRSAYDPDWKRYHPRTYVDDIRHLLIAAGAHEVIVIGTSLGGILAAALSVVLPSGLRGVVLNDVGPDVDRDGLEQILTYLRDAKPLPDWEAAAAHLKATFPHMPARNPLQWRMIAESTYVQGEDGLLRFDWDPKLVKPFDDTGAEPIDLWPLFRALRNIPVLTVRGGVSTILSAETLEKMHDALPGMRSVTVPDIGHAPNLSEPEVLEAIDELIG